MNDLEFALKMRVWQFRSFLEETIEFPHNHPVTMGVDCPTDCCVKRARDVIAVLGDEGKERP